MSSLHTIQTHRGLSLVETLIGIGLLLLVLAGVMGVFQTTLELVTHNKAKVGALSLAGERMEYIRNLNYDAVGTQGGIPAGNIPQTETVSFNNVDYTRRVLIQYVDDPKDGTGSNDNNNITADYKRAKVEVLWKLRGSTSSVSLVTNVVPPGIESTQGGGTLIAKVFDAVGDPVTGANVHIENATTSPTISVDVSTDSDGDVMFPGAPASGGYEVTVSKTDYSTAQTYDTTAENQNPNPGHLTVLEDQTTVQSFAIDEVSEKTVRTYHRITDEAWIDSFTTSNNISDGASTTISSGQVELSQKSAGVYNENGYIYSTAIATTSLHTWEELNWSDETPGDTQITYHVYYEDNNGDRVRIPDSALPNNSTGFSNPPVDLSGLATSTYDTLYLKADFTTPDTSRTPTLYEWSVAYERGPLPFGNVDFHMRGSKTIGTDNNGDPVYKYDKDHQTNASGELAISDLEWDGYTITVDNATLGYDVSRACPPQPRSIAPGTQVTTDLYFAPHTTHSLKVAVRDNNGSLVEDAFVRLYRPSSGYDTTKQTRSCGQAFFGGLVDASNYKVDVSADGTATSTTNNVSVDGTSAIEVTVD